MIPVFCRPAVRKLLDIKTAVYQAMHLTLHSVVCMQSPAAVSSNGFPLSGAGTINRFEKLNRFDCEYVRTKYQTKLMFAPSQTNFVASGHLAIQIKLKYVLRLFRKHYYL